MGKDYLYWMEIAKSAALDAGRYLIKAQGRTATVTSEIGRDIKLSVDRGSEDRIVSILRKRSSFPVFGEEMNSVWAPADDEGYQWIVDPLDGSLNYWKGIPICCVSIGLWKGESPVLGVVYDFNRDEMFTGIVGHGVSKNQTPISVGNVSDPSHAVLCTGFPVSTDFSASSIQQHVESIMEFKKIRLIGSAALSLAYVACGRADAYYERDIKVWDIAAGVALVNAAGGVTEYNFSSKPNCMTVFSGNGKLDIFSANSSQDISEQ